jgi:AcrR family transcriptional regulator
VTLKKKTPHAGPLAPRRNPATQDPKAQDPEALDPVVRDLLEVAVSEFAQHGLAGARVDAIAARTSTSKRMLYYHFGSKEGLYEAALTQAYARVRSTSEPAGLDTLPALLALRAYVGHVFDTHASHPEFVRLVMGENLLGGRFVSQGQAIRAGNMKNLQALGAILTRGQAEGSVRPDLDFTQVYANTVGLAFHFVSNRATFSTIFEQGLDPAQVAAQRRAAIIETIERQVVMHGLVSGRKS